MCRLRLEVQAARLRFRELGRRFVPARTPRTVVMKLNAEIGAALPDTGDRESASTEMGLVPRHSTPEAFGQFLQAEIKRWGALLKKPSGEFHGDEFRLMSFAVMMKVARRV